MTKNRTSIIPPPPSMKGETRDRPMLFDAESVRAILAGRKTQTRRAIWSAVEGFKCPYGVPGDYLWGRETWARLDDGRVLYRADGPQQHPLGKDGFDQQTWKPSIFMERRYSRISLIVSSVRRERLHAITEADAIAEGWPPDGKQGPLDWFRWRWNEINYKNGAGWDTNPELWVVEFRVREKK